MWRSVGAGTAGAPRGPSPTPAPTAGLSAPAPTWRSGQSWSPTSANTTHDSCKRIHSVSEPNGSFGPWILCKRLGELHESKLALGSFIKFIFYKLSIFLLVYPGE